MNTHIMNLGTSTNLIMGLKSDWNPKKGILDILQKPTQQAMAEKAPNPIEERGNWGFPNIGLHDNAEDLLDALIPYQVRHPASETDAPEIGAGALLIGAPDRDSAITNLSKSLGIDLSKNYSYALVKISRQDGIARHQSASTGILMHLRPRVPDEDFELSDDFLSSSTKLVHAGRSRLQDFGEKMTKENITRIFDSFYGFGTHYVSALDLGDTILQVFAYLPERYEEIKKAYANQPENLNGPNSTSFAQFTTSHAAGVYGFVEDYGNVISLSNGSNFQSTLAAGDWKDSLWSHENSIFSLFGTSSKISLQTLDDTFKDQTVTRVELASLGVMIEQKRSMIWQRFFKAAMVQRFRNSIQANFAIYDHRDFATMLPEDQTGVISYLSTPTINLYKTRLNLSGMQFVARDEVKKFTLFSNVLSDEGHSLVKIPGDKISLISQVIDMRTSSQPKAIQLTDDGFKNLEIACDEFLGSLTLENESGSEFSVIVDGFRFGLEGPESRPVVLADVRTTPSPSIVPDLVNNLQFSMAFAESVMSDQSANPKASLQDFVRSYLRWLTTIIPADSDEQQLIALRVRALDLAQYALNPNLGSFVPILPFKIYEQYVESILSYLDRIQIQIATNEQKMANRRLEELTINVGKTLNKNIIDSGELLTGVIRANVAQQDSLAGFYDSLIKQKQTEAARQQAKVNDLQATLSSAQSEMDFAVQKYKQAVTQKEIEDGIKFGLEVATNLFSLGVTIATPASAISAVKEMATIVQVIQKTLNVLNASAKLFSGVESEVKALTGAQKALDGLDGLNFGDPSTLSWDELSIKFKQIMATGPSVAAKADLEAAFATLILRGKAVTSASSTLHGLQRDIYTNQLQKKINSDQSKRLSALEGKLKPSSIKDLDLPGIDLMALTGHLSFVRDQMLTILAKAFVQQDLALQYANLQPATPIASFSLLKFSEAIVHQKAATIKAKSALATHQASITKPIEYRIEKVASADLLNGSSSRFAIFLDATEFYQYVDSRIIAVVASVEGVQSSESGNFLVELSYLGSPFHDRNIQRESLNFHTPRRSRIYEYSVEGNIPKFSDGGDSWSDGVSRVTPFSEWEVSLPNTKINKGIKLDDLVNLKLSFVLEARIVDTENALRQRASLRLADEARQVPFHLSRAVPAFSAQNLVLATEAAGALPPATTVISQMYSQGTCTNGWDVVFNMGLSEINNVLKTQYETLKKNTTYKNTINVETSEKYPGNVTVINKFKINYGYPLLNFSVNNANSATLDLEILEGTVQKCSKVGDGPLNCDDPQSIKGETLTAVISLAKVAGDITVENAKHKVLRVELDMKKGAFSISNIKLSDETKVEFNAAVKAYFVENPVVFLINQLDITSIPTLEALRPNNFIFKPLETPSKNKMLQLFIMTGNRALLNYSQAFLNNIPEPLPIDQTASMMIRSELIFNEVLPQSLQKNGWALAGVNPGKGKAWSGKFTNASVTGTVDLSPLNHSVSSGGQGGGSTIRYTYSIPGGNDVSWSLVDTTLTVQASGQLKYGGSKSQKLNFTERACSTYYPCFFNCGPKCSDSARSSDVTVDASAILPIKVGGSGRNQTITIGTTSQNIDVTGHLAGGGPSDTDDLQAKVNQQIKKQVPAQIEKKLTISFNAISVFALKNLLFPANNYIAFGESSIPGDLLLLGSFSSDT